MCVCQCVCVRAHVSLALVCVRMCVSGCVCQGVCVHASVSLAWCVCVCVCEECLGACVCACVSLPRRPRPKGGPRAATPPPRGETQAGRRTPRPRCGGEPSGRLPPRGGAWPSSAPQISRLAGDPKTPAWPYATFQGEVRWVRDGWVLAGSQLRPALGEVHWPCKPTAKEAGAAAAALALGAQGV